MSTIGTLTERKDVFPIKTRSGTVIGYLREKSSYRREILSRSFALLGFYNPRTDRTFKRDGNLLGYGDLRAVLLGSVLNESQANQIGTAEFVNSKSMGSFSNLKQDAPSYNGDSVDQELSGFPEDDVATGINYEESRGIKKDSYRAKEEVLKNLKKNPNWYSNPAFFITAAGADNDDQQLTPPSTRLGSADQPPLEDVNERAYDLDDPKEWRPSTEPQKYVKPDSFEKLPPTQREKEKEAEEKLKARMGATPNDLDESIRRQAITNFRESIKKSFPHVTVESRTNGIVMLKDNAGNHAAFMPVGDGFDAFSLFLRGAAGNERGFLPYVKRKELQMVLDRYFKKKK